MGERVFYDVADIDDPNAEYPLAVIAIYPDRPNSGGCVGIVKSLHTNRADAEREAEAYRSGPQ